MEIEWQGHIKQQNAKRDEKNVFAHLYRARAGIVDDDGISHAHFKCGH